MIVRSVTVMSLLLAVIVGVGFEPKEAAAERAAKRPNIVLIMTDDQDYASMKYMPKTRQNLVRKGTSFSKAFISTSLCCPSRATFLRGQYEHNHGVISNTAPDGGYDRFRRLGREKSTVATWLQAGGYETILLGKYLNEYDAKRVPPGWDQWFARTHGYVNGGTAFQLNENGRLRAYPKDKYHGEDVLRKKAGKFIRSRDKNSGPFFMYVATKAPHSPAESAPRHNGMFKGVPLPRPPSFNEADISDKPKKIYNKRRMTKEEIKDVTRDYRQRLRSLQATDDLVGAVVRAVRETGELNNTYFVFTSDNGWMQGEHRLPQGKGTPYEESIRVPFVVRGPGVPQDRRLNHIIANTDFAPTVADLAGVSAPGFVDGRSIRPLLRSNPPPLDRWRGQVLIEHVTYYRAVRTQNAKYVEYNNGEKQLYDLSRDRYELESQHESNPEMVADMQARLKALKGCSGGSCREAENR